MTQDEMIAMLATIGVAPHERCPVDWTGYVIVFQRFAELVAAKEREAIAAHYAAQPHVEFFGSELADEIRARGQKGGV